MYEMKSMIIIIKKVDFISQQQVSGMIGGFVKQLSKNLWPNCNKIDVSSS